MDKTFKYIVCHPTSAYIIKNTVKHKRKKGGGKKRGRETEREEVRGRERERKRGRKRGRGGGKRRAEGRGTYQIVSKFFSNKLIPLKRLSPRCHCGVSWVSLLSLHLVTHPEFCECRRSKESGRREVGVRRGEKEKRKYLIDLVKLDHHHRSNLGLVWQRV